MDCPKCHAKNAFRPVYGASGSSMHYDEGSTASTLISGAICYACGKWIEPVIKPVEMRPIEETNANIHRPVSAHRKKASEALNRQLMAHVDTIVSLRKVGVRFRDIADHLAKLRVRVSYTKLSLWYKEIVAAGDQGHSCA